MVRLSVPAALRRTPATTNPIESALSATPAICLFHLENIQTVHRDGAVTGGHQRSTVQVTVCWMGCEPTPQAVHDPVDRISGDAGPDFLEIVDPRGMIALGNRIGQDRRVVTDRLELL